MTMSAAEVKSYRDKMKEAGGGGEGRGAEDWFALREPGTAYLRIGKPWTKGGEIWKEVLFHQIWNNNPELGKKVYCAKNEIDPETGKPRKCPVCRREKQLRTEGRSKHSKILFGYVVQKMDALWNVLVAKVKTTDEGKVIVRKYLDGHFKKMQLSRAWHLELVDLFAEPEYRAEDALGICSHTAGYLVRMTREGVKLKTEYKFKVIGKPCPLSTDKEKRIKLGKTLHDLDKVVKASSDEELRAFVKIAEKRARKAAEREEAEDRDDEDLEDSDDDEGDDE